jgi:hypothetical protein
LAFLDRFRSVLGRGSLALVLSAERDELRDFSETVTAPNSPK